MNPSDILRQMNEDAANGELEVLDLKAFDYLSLKKVQIQVVRNNDNFELNTMAAVRLKRKFKKNSIAYIRTRDREIEARDNYLLEERSRIQRCIEVAKPYDKQEYLQDEIDKYHRRRMVPDFKELIRIYKAKYPEYEAPNEWWLDQVHVSNILLNWLSSSQEPIMSSQLATVKAQRAGLKDAKAKFSYSAYAKALSLKNITITKKGIGTIDRVDYAAKFDLASGPTLYNKYNDLVNEKILDSRTLENQAQEILKIYNL